MMTPATTSGMARPLRGEKGPTDLCVSGDEQHLPAREVLQAARDVTSRLGVTRSVPITAFDRIGLPVWTSVRPGSSHLIVNGGKGLSDAAGEVSARLECLEQVAAEQPTGYDRICTLTLREAADQDPVLLGYERRHLTTGAHWDLDTPTDWISVTDSLRDRRSLAPVEAVYFPVPPGLRTGLPGATTRGLACGTNLAAAVVHGWYEVLERHAASLARIDALPTYRVDIDSLTGARWDTTYGILRRIKAARVEPLLRVARWGPFWFAAALLCDRERPEGRFHNGGYGLHLDARATIDAALLEAVQARATWIHGTRDDLPEKAPEALHTPNPAPVDQYHRPHGHDEAAQLRSSFAAGPHKNADDLVAPRLSGPVLPTVLDGIVSLGFVAASYYQFPGDFGPFHVVRSLIPGTEDFSPWNPWVGRNLLSTLRTRSEYKSPAAPEKLC